MATVPTLHPWEAQLVDELRATGMARVIERASDRSALLSCGADVIVVGSAAPFLSVELLRRLGSDRVVVGVVTGRDPAAAKVFHDAGVDAVFHDAVPLEALMRLIAGSGGMSAQPPHRTVVVRGVRGAPGCTEVAIALSVALARTARCVLVDADREAPSIGLRLGLPPGSSMQSVWGLDVFAPFDRRGRATMSSIDRVVEHSQRTHRFTVVDLGGAGDAVCGDVELLVVTPSPVSLVRAARVLRSAPMPVVANRMREGDLPLVRQAIGTEPLAIVPEAAIRFGESPDEGIVGAMSAVVELLGGSQGAAAR